MICKHETTVSDVVRAFSEVCDGFTFGLVRKKLKASCDGVPYPITRLMNVRKEFKNRVPLAIVLAAVNSDIYRWRCAQQDQRELFVMAERKKRIGEGTGETHELA